MTLPRSKERTHAIPHSRIAIASVNPLPQALPNVKAIIIGCADMRVDPADILGIKPGEAAVMRNIGCRITPGLLEQLGLLGRIGEVAGKILEAAVNFISSYFSIPIAASLASWATPPCWRTIFIKA
jgi:hypothetical protein